jgi:hypothetical protein
MLELTMGSHEPSRSETPGAPAFPGGSCDRWTPARRPGRARRIRRECRVHVVHTTWVPHPRRMIWYERCQSDGSPLSLPLAAVPRPAMSQGLSGVAVRGYGPKVQDLWAGPQDPRTGLRIHGQASGSTDRPQDLRAGPRDPWAGPRDPWAGPRNLRAGPEDLRTGANVDGGGIGARGRRGFRPLRPPGRRPVRPGRPRARRRPRCPRAGRPAGRSSGWAGRGTATAAR